jgi:hypothetical protein
MDCHLHPVPAKNHRWKDNGTGVVEAAAACCGVERQSNKFEIANTVPA